MKTPKTWKESFKEFYERLSEMQQSALRIKVIDSCGVSESTFYRWRKGMTLPPFDCRKKINGIAQRMGLDRVYTPKKTI